jgi:hypothetical protein
MEDVSWARTGVLRRDDSLTGVLQFRHALGHVIGRFSLRP